MSILALSWIKFFIVFLGVDVTSEGIISILAPFLLTIVLFAWILWPEKNPFHQRVKTRLDYLRERKEAIYENLRDLNFEYKAGKYPEEDYSAQRLALENEAAGVIAEIETLESANPLRFSH
jgi:hypothetical protein